MSEIFVPNTQWAQVLDHLGGAVQYREIPIAEPGPDEVLVNVKYSGVCHTDLHAADGDWPIPVKSPLVGGHEGAGIVVKKGRLVKDLELGDHVGIKWINNTCLSCEYCRQADEPLCARAALSGYTVDGSFQQYCVVNAVHAAPIPKDVSLDAIAPILCAGITVYKALKESGLRAGQTIAIVGAGGGLGALAQQYARAMGLRSIAIDSGEDKRRACLDHLGSYAFIDYQRSCDIVKDVKTVTHDGLGPHAVLLAAVSEGPFQQAAEYVRARGTVVCVGLPSGAFLRAPVFESVVKMINIRGSYVGNRQDSAEAIEFFRQGKIKAPFKVIGLSELQMVYDEMRQGRIVGRYVVDTSQ